MTRTKLPANGSTAQEDPIDADFAEDVVNGLIADLELVRQHALQAELSGDIGAFRDWLAAFRARRTARAKLNDQEQAAGKAT